MPSSVLRSPQPVEVNTAIMWTFVQHCRLMDASRNLARKVEELYARYDEQFVAVFEAIKRLIAGSEAAAVPPERRIGFIP